MGWRRLGQWARLLYATLVETQQDRKGLGVGARGELIRRGQRSR
jgi:hypothetical protein